MDFEKMVEIIGSETNISIEQVKNTIFLLDDEKTIPFIARYRKEVTKSLNEIQIRDIWERIQYLRKLQQRKEAIEKSINEQGKWTEELARQFSNTMTLQEVENLYQPYKKHKKTKAEAAKEKGLEGLSQKMKQSIASLEAEMNAVISEENGLPTLKEVLRGCLDIIREEINYSPEIRKSLFNRILEKAEIQTEQMEAPDPKGIYKDFYQFHKPIHGLEEHRILAINRGEKEKIIKVKVILQPSPFPQFFYQFGYPKELYYFQEIHDCLQEGYEELLYPSVVREVRNVLTEKSEKRAIEVFSKNLRQLMLLPPLKKKTILGIDPGLRTGCKCAIVDGNGFLKDYFTIYPHVPNRAVMAGSLAITAESMNSLDEYYQKTPFEIVAIGNGTASRETEEFVSDWISERKHPSVSYLIVSEAGASVYSASESGIEEFPELDLTTRGAISIARRVQDPLAESVKIPPESIGVGMYQHDVALSELQRVLAIEVESVVNFVGVDLNQASPFLLQYVSGLNRSKAWKIHAYKTENGVFTSREELKKVKGIGEKTYELAAGFCRVPESENPLDNTILHPESYGDVFKITRTLGISLEDIQKRSEIFYEKTRHVDTEFLSKELDIDVIKVKDIVDALTSKHVDPRDEYPQPLLKKEVRNLDDLKEGMILQGTVRNVVDFGAFVDIGVKVDGLIHQSQFGKKWAKPLEEVSVGEIIKVRILKVEKERARINLAFIQ